MPTPGYRIELKQTVPQGFNSAILLLDKVVTPPKGPQSDKITMTDVIAYEELTGENITHVTILPDDTTVVVRDVH